MTSIDHEGVLYGATLDIPYAIGSVSIPLASSYSQSSDHARAGTETAVDGARSQAQRRGVSSGNISSVRRCTHHRYCYIRDGGSLEQDAFYRWLLHEQQQLAQRGVSGDEASSELKASAATRSVKDEAEDSTANSSPTSPDKHVDDQKLSHSQSPSLFYASISCVVFILPNSFPRPRRVLRRPPFIIADDTWAEHVVEVQLHFHDHLRIPPVTVVHQALLERHTPPTSSPQQQHHRTSEWEEAVNKGTEVRGVWVPQLLACNYGKAKLPPLATTVTVTTTTSSTPTAADRDRLDEANDSSVAAPCPQYGLWTAAASHNAVVAEKVDTLRLYHPTMGVTEHHRRTLALSALPEVQTLRELYEEAVRSDHRASATPLTRDTKNSEGNPGEDAEAEATQGSPFLYPWSLPFEGVIAEYAEQRATTSVAVLRAVLAGLKRERATLEETCQRSLTQIAHLATTTLPERLSDVHQRCLKLYRKEQ